MEDNTLKKEINLSRIIKLSLQNWKLFSIVLITSFIVSCVIVLSKPRYYTCEVKLAPEIELPSNGSLGSIASSFGFDIGSAISQDAISPTLYPDLFESNDFVIRLFDIKVKNYDNTIKTDYYTYLKDYQKHPWWSGIKGWVNNLFKPKEPSAKINVIGKPDAFRLTKMQSDIAATIKANIKCHVDKKTDVITISVTDQDKLICATMADSVKVILQNFITDYRTNKARVDLEYYTKLTQDAKKDYEEARRKYGNYADANTDIVLESYKAKQADMENDMQLKYNTYTALNNQLQATKAKVQERTPAFTILKCASVPIKPSGPKRMIFIIGVMFLAFTCTLLYILRKDLAEQL